VNAPDYALNLFRVRGELKVDGVNERMKALFDAIDRNKRIDMLDTIIGAGWEPDLLEPGKFRKDLVAGYIVCSLDDAYEFELKTAKA